MDAPDTKPSLRLSQKIKLKKNFTDKKRLIFVSKAQFDLKVKGYRGKFWAAILPLSWMYFMCARKYLEVFRGGHVIVMRFTTF
jgi:hypothetical protein